jgi:hypothetical protein
MWVCSDMTGEANGQALSDGQHEIPVVLPSGEYRIVVRGNGRARRIDRLTKDGRRVAIWNDRVWAEGRAWVVLEAAGFGRKGWVPFDPG